MTNRIWKTTILSMILTMGLMGCDMMPPVVMMPDMNVNDNNNDDDPVVPQVDNNNDGIDVDDNTDPNDMDNTPASNTWSQLTQPCGGTRTDALWFDDRDNGYIGCGTNGSGMGLFVTSDGGVTWDAQLNFEEVRVNDIFRAADGNLYATGTDTAGGFEVFMIDESGAQRQLVGLYTGSNNAFTAVSQGENIAVTQDGQMFVDSLTGTQSAYRDAGEANFNELSTFLSGGQPSEQMSRVIAYNNQFWGVGSVINRPGTVYYPTGNTTSKYEMNKIEVQPSTMDGELHDIHLWSGTSGLVCGFDQSLRFPLIYSLDGDPSDINSWTKINLADSGITYQGGAWKMSVIGDVVVLVGQTFPTNNGFVVFSADRGLTWNDLSPVFGDGSFAANLMTNVRFFSDGTVLAAAESGEMWRYNP